VQEKVTKKKGTPVVRSFGLPSLIKAITGRQYETSCFEVAKLGVTRGHFLWSPSNLPYNFSSLG